MSYSKKTHRLQRSTRSTQAFPPPAPEPGDMEPPSEDGPPNAPKPKLLDRVREEMRTRHMAKRTEKAYVSWIKRFIFFFDKRHPDTMGGAEISAFASYLANVRKVSASTQSQALSALLFLYRSVLGREIEEMEITRAKRGTKLPLVLSRDEVAAVLRQTEGDAPGVVEG